MDPSEGAPPGFVEWTNRVANYCDRFAKIFASDLAMMSDDDAATAMHAYAAKMFDTVYETTIAEDVRTNVTCKPGCHSCCSINIESAWYEAIHVAKILLSVPDGPARSALFDRIREYAEEVWEMTDEQRLAHSRMCPFIDEDDGLCTIYPHRPLLCRAHYIVDGPNCSSGDPVQMLLAPKVIASIVGHTVFGMRPPPRPLDRTSEFITAVHYHILRLSGEPTPRLPKPELGDAARMGGSGLRAIFDPRHGDDGPDAR